MFKDLKTKTKDFMGDVKEYGDTVLNGRDDVPPKVRGLVKRFKDVPIVGITINRTPVNEMLIKALNTVSSGHFGSKLEESPYDKLYHLRIDCKLQNGKTVKLEKNEVVNADVNPSVAKDAETKVLGNMKQGLTLKGLLQGGERVMGNKFIPYDAVHNNCQDFIMGILRGSDIGDQSDFDFIKQHTKDFFKGKDQKHVRQTAKFLTDAGGKVNEIIYGHGVEGKIKSVGKTLSHPVHTTHHVKEAVGDVMSLEGKILKDIFTGKIKSLKDITKYKGTKKLYDKYNDEEGIKGSGGKSIKILKNKPSTSDNMSDTDTDHEGDYSSSDEEIMGSGLHEESDIMHRMAKLSHDIHRHHQDHGMKKRVVKGYQLLGDGIKHSIVGCGKYGKEDFKAVGGAIGGKVNRVKKFNRWFKAIGSKFKTLNHNLQPIKRAGEDMAVQKINPLSAAENYLNDFQREAPETMEAIRSAYGSSKKVPVEADYVPEASIQPYKYDYSGYNLPSVPVASPFMDSEELYHSQMYGGNVIKTSITVAKDLITAGGDRAVRAIEGSGMATRQAQMELRQQRQAEAAAQAEAQRLYDQKQRKKERKKDNSFLNKAGDALSTGGKTAYSVFKGTSEAMMFPYGNPYSVGYGVGGNVIKTSKDVAKDLITAGGDRAVRAIEGSGRGRGRPKRSTLQNIGDFTYGVAKGTLMPYSTRSGYGVGGNVIKTSKDVAKDLITAGGDRAVRAIEGSNVIKTSKTVAKDLITAGGDRAVRAIEGSGAKKRGRLVKGSPEAKEWARKMREAKMNKR